jgi:flagellar biosynthesis repressor protein FlbT
MPLRFDLGPFEQLFIGKSVLTNGGDRTTFIVEGNTPMLRGRDVLMPDQAVTTLAKLYRCVQQMYLEEDIAKYQGSYLALAAQIISELPDCCAALQASDGLIKNGQHYKALKELKKLIEKHAVVSGGAQTKASLTRVVARAHG